MEQDSLETALAEAEAQNEATLKAAAAVVRELKRVQTSARLGHLRNLDKALDAARGLAGQLASAAKQQRTDWTFAAESHLESGAYTDEVLAVARGEGVKAFHQDDQIVSYPSLVKVQPAALAVTIDKKRNPNIRPSVLVAELARLQNRAPRFKADAFLESLVKAYEVLVQRGSMKYDATLKLMDVYDLLTMLPGQKSDYSKQEFARDLYLLDLSGVTVTRRGRELRFAASTLTKGSQHLTTVSRDGQQKVYAGISFS